LKDKLGDSEQSSTLQNKRYTLCEQADSDTSSGRASRPKLSFQECQNFDYQIEKKSYCNRAKDGSTCTYGWNTDQREVATENISTNEVNV